jgi:hypothetical protein
MPEGDGRSPHGHHHLPGTQCDVGHRRNQDPHSRGRLFSAVEHWSAECVGWHVVKRGTRYAALEPIAMGLHDIYGGTQAGVARGLSLRMDHGTQYLSDQFLKQTRYWASIPAFLRLRAGNQWGRPSG